MDISPLLQEWTFTPTETRKQAIQSALASHINHLILHDFSALIQLLYLVDIPEKKAKMVLLENPDTDAGDLLANLILQRQKEKKEAREKFRVPPGTSEEEKW